MISTSTVYAGALNTILSMTALCAVLSFMWMGISNFPGLVVFAVLYDLFQGGLVSILPGSIVPLTPDMR
ncbi:cation efflux family protein [Apiospora arundinis]